MNRNRIAARNARNGWLSDHEMSPVASALQQLQPTDPSGVEPSPGALVSLCPDCDLEASANVVMNPPPPIPSPDPAQLAIVQQFMDRTGAAQGFRANFKSFSELLGISVALGLWCIGIQSTIMVVPGRIHSKPMFSFNSTIATNVSIATITRHCSVEGEFFTGLINKNALRTSWALSSSLVYISILGFFISFAHLVNLEDSRSINARRFAILSLTLYFAAVLSFLGSQPEIAVGSFLSPLLMGLGMLWVVFSGAKLLSMSTSQATSVFRLGSYLFVIFL